MWYLWANFSLKSNSKRHMFVIMKGRKNFECLYSTKKFPLRKTWESIAQKFMKIEHTCELVITALTRAVQLNTLLQFTMLRNHSNVTFVTPVFTKRNTFLRFMKVRNLSHLIYLCNQSYLKKECLRRHISAVHWKVIWSKRHSFSPWWKTKIFKCSICEALVLKNPPLDSTSIKSFTGVFINK